MINLLRYWKAILGGIGVLSIIGGVYHYQGVVEENEQLQETVSVQQSQIVSLETQYDNLEQSLVRYQQDMEQQQIKNDSLRTRLNRLGDLDDQLQECLNVRLPDDFINGLSE